MVLGCFSSLVAKIRRSLYAVGKSMGQIRHAVGSNVVDPKLLTSAEGL
ncbi:hypothetical protein EV286_11721 [Rhizobium sp. BK251]|nr:hypothetical protein EV286_11721 [Rhizobium sp. BK251]